MPAKVRVAVRIRPMLTWEKNAGHTDKQVKYSPENQEIMYFLIFS